MAAKERRRLDFERSQNIALLSLLTQNPASPEPNTCASSVPRGEKGRVLSFKRESHLAEALAFISGISNRPEDVVAICIEELSGGGGLRVLVAVNRSTHNSAADNQLLRRIKAGLEGVFRVLARTGTANDPALEEQTLDAIIDLCRGRILSRIRSQRDDVSRSGPKGERPFSGSNLHNILSAVRRHSFRDSRLQSDVKLFIRQAESLLEAVNKVESSKSNRVNVALKNLVVTACSLHRGRRAVDTEAMLSDLTTKELDPSDTKWLKGFIKRLARYRECSGYLLQVSKKHVLLRNATVIPVSLGQECFIPQEDSPGDQCLANCVSRCRNGAAISETSHAQARATSLREIGNGRFLKALQPILKGARIHAEVQIVAYYELHPPAIQPRIIKSSKDACYLCNLFIKEHGKFHTPRTHGRLYTGWRLPSLEKLNPVQIKLNRSLQARIWHASLEYMTIKRPQTLICVNESDVGSLSSMSSLGSFGLLTGEVDAVDKTATAAKVNGKKAILSPKGKSAPGTSGQPVAKTDGTNKKGGTSQASQSRRETPQVTIVQSASKVPVQGGPKTSKQLETIREVEHEPLEMKGPIQVIEEAGLTPKPTFEEPEAREDIPQHSNSAVPAQAQEITEEDEAKDQPKIQPEPEPVTEHTLTTPEESPQDGDPLVSEPESKSTDLTSQSNPPTSPNPTPKFEQEGDKDQIFLTQGQVSTFRLDSNQRIPSYHTGKSGKLIIYPEFIISPATTSSTSPSTSKGGGTAELRITWLLPSQSQSQPQERGHKNPEDVEHGNNDTGTKPAFLGPDAPKNIPEYLAESIPTSEDIDTGSSEFVRLVNGGGETVSIEVVRS